MAKRKNKKYRRVDTADVQGEGSFVVIQSPGYDALGDLMAFAELKAGADEQVDVSKISPETIGAIFGLLEKVVVEWDWVDDDGNPLPQPKDDPDVIKRETTQEEQNFLVEHLDFGGVDAKN